MAFVKKIIDILLLCSTVAIATQFLYYTLIDTDTHNGSLSEVLTTSLRRAAIAAIYLSAKTTESGYSRKISMTNLRETAIAATAHNPCI